MRVIIIQCISVFSYRYKLAFITSFTQAEQNTETLEYLGRQEKM